MFKSIQPLCHRYLLLLSVALCVFITAACDDENTDCDDEMTDCATPSINNTATATNPPSSATNTAIPTIIPEGEALLVCGQIVRETDHPGAYNEPVIFSNTAEATLVLLKLIPGLGGVSYVGLTTQSGPFELPLDYCITGPASLLDTDDTYVVSGAVHQDSDNPYKIGDLYFSQKIHNEANPLAASFDIYGVTLPQYDAVTPLAGLEDCTADNSQFDCVIACDHPDLTFYGSCKDDCAENPSQSNCFVEQSLP